MVYPKNYKVKNNRPARLRRIVLILLFCGLFFQSTYKAQETSTNSAASPSPSPSPSLSPTPIPFSEIISQSEADISKLKEIAASASVDSLIINIEQNLPNAVDEINVRLDTTTQVLAERTTIDKLRSLESDWGGSVRNLQDWNSKLTAQGRKLESDLAQVVELDKKWKAGQKEFENTEVPPEIETRIQTIFNIINETRRQIEIQQARIVSLQGKLAEQEKRVNEAVKTVKQAREALVGRLFARDSPPIWSSQLWSQSPAQIQSELSSLINKEIQSFNDFVKRHDTLFIGVVFLLIIFAGILFLMRRWINPRVQENPALQKAAVIFYQPISTAVIITFFLTILIYDQPPKSISLIFGMAIFISTVFILRKLVEKPLYPILYALVVFNLFDQLRTVFDSQMLVSRLLFLGEMLGGVIFLMWLYRSHLKKSLTADIVQSGIFRTFRYTLLIAVPAFALAFFANVLGFVELSQILGNAVLQSAYVALIFYALVRIIDGLIIFSLRFPPLSLLKMVANHRELIQKKIRRFARIIFFILWIIITLEFLSLLDWVGKLISGISDFNLGYGSLNIKIGDIVGFVVTIWAAFALSRFVRFVLDEDVYSRFPLERGLPYAISTLLRYAILLIGFFLAVAGAGLDLSRFTILVGAFGVGIGFGLQNIINNFVSGLILLFERPVKIGDVVKVGDASGTIKRIGIRASVIHVWDSSDVIVPNSKLISENVTNWSFSSQQRGIEIVFRVPPETVPGKIIDIMEKAAEKHPLVNEKPTPQVLFNEISFDHLTFKLRVWTDYFDKVSKIHSDLVLNISEALREEKIPFEKLVSEDIHNK